MTYDARMGSTSSARKLGARSLADLAKEPARVIDQVCREGDHLVITKGGKDQAVILPIADYRAMKDRLEILEGLASSERDSAEGRTFAHDQVMRELRERLDSMARPAGTGE
jgi:prevent-host-death family protein